MWWERTADPSPAHPAGEWTHRTITNVTGQGFGIERVPDLLGDGVDRWVATNHVNTWFNGGAPESAVFQIDQPVDPTGIWPATPISTGIQARQGNPGTLAPGLFGWGDIDGDTDIDIAVSGDGDARLFWLEQQPDDSFQTYVLDNNMGQAGGGMVTDFDGDGNAEVVFTSYEAGVLNLYEAS